MATLRKYKGHWYGYFYDPEKKPTRKCVTLRTKLKSAAEKTLRRLEDDYAAREFDPWNQSGYSVSLSIDEAAEAFHKAHLHHRAKTTEVYVTAFRLLTRELPPGILFAHVQSDHLEKIFRDNSVSAATQNHRARAYRAIFNWGVKAGYIKQNPLLNTQLPKAGKAIPTFLTQSDYIHLLKTIEDDRQGKLNSGEADGKQIGWLKDLITLAVNTGLRRGELINLRWADVDLDNEFLRARNTRDFSTKTGHDRSVPLVPDALTLLHALNRQRPSEDDAYVLLNAKDGKIDGGYASKRFKYYSRQANLRSEIHFHSLRHTYASWLVMAGVSLRVVMEVMGHADIQTTMKYAHLSEDVAKKAVQAALPPIE